MTRKEYISSMEGAGESDSCDSSPSSSISSSKFSAHSAAACGPSTSARTFAVYPLDISDLRQWGLVEKFCDAGYCDCEKTPI